MGGTTGNNERNSGYIMVNDDGVSNQKEGKLGQHVPTKATRMLQGYRKLEPPLPRFNYQQQQQQQQLSKASAVPLSLNIFTSPFLGSGMSTEPNLGPQDQSTWRFMLT